ncbi:hypothetical protein [Roseivirga sp.]|uniref:hypothetical protein n=1 Tax=Roseivirga sp. TaxID=1964215 RepID=UPI003B519F97
MVFVFLTMFKVEVYSDLSQKKPSQSKPLLSKEEALIRTLELMDFYAAISPEKPSIKQVDRPDIEWIELKWKSNDQ